jgi:hypothetical protein
MVTKKKLVDFIHTRDRDGGGEETLALADVAGEDGFVDVPQIDSRVVADDLRVERRVAVGEGDCEA